MLSASIFFPDLEAKAEGKAKAKPKPKAKAAKGWVSGSISLLCGGHFVRLPLVWVDVPNPILWGKSLRVPLFRLVLRET